MKQAETIKKELLKLKNKADVNQKLLQKFLKRIKDKKKLVRSQNPKDHFGVFFLPLDLKTESIFLGDHKKAGCWIPAGGHLEKNESPIETLKREFFEELKYRVAEKQIEFFNLTITDIKNPKQICKRHWDLWYLVRTPKIEFEFDRREFYDGKWHLIKEALTVIKIKNYQAVVRKILDRHHKNIPGMRSYKS